MLMAVAVWWLLWSQMTFNFQPSILADQVRLVGFIYGVDFFLCRYKSTCYVYKKMIIQPHSIIAVQGISTPQKI
jgi:hypothetical protein